jgi:hypothetical protein
MEKRHYLHLWTRLTRCMAGEFYTKNLYKIHCDELVAAWIGELHHKLTLYCGFSFPPNLLGYDRLQPFLMLKHHGKALVDPINKLALGPNILHQLNLWKQCTNLCPKELKNGLDETSMPFPLQLIC